MNRNISVGITMVLFTAIIIVSGEMSEFEKWKQSQNQEFRQFQEDREKEFAQWRAQRDREIAEFQENMTRLWGEYAKPDRERWVEYSADGRGKSIVDFEKGEVRVDVIVDDTSTGTGELEDALKRTLTSKGNISNVPVESKSEDSTVSKDPILAGIVQDKSGNPVTEDNQESFITDKVKEKTESRIEVTDEKDTKVTKKVVTVTFPLVPDYLQKKMDPFIDDVKKYAKEYGVPVNHVLATIHTESYFNPAAKSHVGAIGLMQLMPTSGGHDAYKYVTGNSERPSLKFLYDPENNIKLGCAYIKMLKENYFRKISDDKRRVYCAIAAYNTGAGNVAKTFTGKYNVNKAVPIINGMNEEQVFNKLLADLPYDETKGYLEKVNKRMHTYGRISAE
ncbi:MAG: murein transglycosylase domain-containing protein [Fibrobacterota bacterium]